MRDVIGRLRASGEALDAFVATLDPPALEVPVEGGEWRGADVLAHLLQAELVYAVRVGQVLTRDAPVIPAYDQEAWVRRMGGFDGDPSSWVLLHGALRSRLLAILASLDDAEWDRAGKHEERGEESVRAIADHLVAHDAEHLAQLRAVLASHV